MDGYREADGYGNSKIWRQMIWSEKVRCSSNPPNAATAALAVQDGTDRQTDGQTGGRRTVSIDLAPHSMQAVSTKSAVQRDILDTSSCSLLTSSLLCTLK